MNIFAEIFEVKINTVNERVYKIEVIEWRWCLKAFSTCQRFDGKKLTHFVHWPENSGAYVVRVSVVCFTLCLRIRIENDNNNFIGLAEIMESTNRRRRQKSYPCNGLRPIIRLWGIVTSIGKHWCGAKPASHDSRIASDFLLSHTKNVFSLLVLLFFGRLLSF